MAEKRNKEASRRKPSSGKPDKLWGGRFEGATRKDIEAFTASISFDHVLYRHDIRQSQAHARALEGAGLLTAKERKAVVSGLEAVRNGLESGRLVFSSKHEDVHMNIEALLAAEIGPAAGKLHAARSRNDQVAADVRMYVKESAARLRSELARLRRALVDRADERAGDVMPGFTHLQNAQPTTVGHHLMAYYEMFTRDDGRLRDCLERLDECPLGSCAMAGTALPIDRDFLARELGFARPTRNSMDAVSDRDYIIEFVFCCALVMAHLSRACEEWAIWMSQEFSFIDLPDAFCTGSSIMPHKKNPDIVEIIRGKTGRVLGDLVALLTTLKGLPLTYNSDLQEDKPALFDAADTATRSVGLFAEIVKVTEFKTARMRERLTGGFTVSVDLTDYLVEKGVPFRETHAIVGGLVKRCLEEGKTFGQLTLEEFREASPLFDGKVFDRLSPEGSVKGKTIYGGPSPAGVRRQVKAARRALDGKAR